VRRLARLTAVACLAALAAVPLGAAADRMWIGFHDDPNFRWQRDRTAMLDRAKTANATMFRAVVTWATVAPRRPANATNPFDKAYRLNDVDQLIRDSQARGMEVLLTIWGTPRWANGGKGPAYLPRNLRDLRNFSQALARRYSGRYAGYPFVRFWSVWNESNLQLFLAPQFDSKGKSVAPKNYAKLYASAYAGIKAGNSRALVGIGETSSAGRDKVLAGKSGTHSPGRFAQLVAQANPRLKFDAWAHHPYPVPVKMKPTQKVRWPNVSLASLPQFEKSIDVWFNRKGIPIWITEYGHETRPAEKAGVTEAQQASYIKQALALTKKDPRCQMFIWFVLKDSRTSLWQSGLYAITGRAKAGRASFTSSAKPLDARNAVVRAKGGTRPSVAVSMREFGHRNPTGAPIGVTYRLIRGSSSVAIQQPQVAYGIDGWIRFSVDYPVRKGTTYTLRVDANDVYGMQVRRTLTIKGV
jgi:Cellulase (glycosyl hydrolase family 5)